MRTSKHFPEWTFVFVMITTVQFLGTSFAHARGNTDGGGGDPDGVDAMAVATRAVDNAERIGSSLVTRNEISQLRKVLARYRVLMIEKPARSELAGRPQEGAAFSRRRGDVHITELTRSRWQKFTSEWKRQAFMLHEVAVLAGLEGTGDYRISARFPELVAKLESSAVDKLRRAAAHCLARGISNPEALTCYDRGLRNADLEISRTLSAIKGGALTGTDAHGRRLENAWPTLAAQQVAFEEYRRTSASVAAVADGGTGSDQAVSSAEHAFDLTLDRLERLKKLFRN